jgi:hypothetical protein
MIVQNSVIYHFPNSWKSWARIIILWWHHGHKPTGTLSGRAAPCQRRCRQSNLWRLESCTGKLLYLTSHSDTIVAMAELMFNHPFRQNYLMWDWPPRAFQMTLCVPTATFTPVISYLHSSWSVTSCCSSLLQSQWWWQISKVHLAWTLQHSHFLFRKFADNHLTMAVWLQFVWYSIGMMHFLFSMVRKRLFITIAF